MAFAATGHLPFGGGSYETIFYRIISGRADLSGVPGPLVPLISAALARDPSHRPSASWLSAQVVTLDMSAATATYAGAPLTETQYPREVVSIPAVPSAVPPAPAPAARVAAAPPAPKQAARDVADLLPPVSYPRGGKQQNQPPYRDQAGPWGPQGPKPAGAAPAPAAASAPASRPAARPNTAAGLAIMVALVALTMMLPVAGLLVALAVITLLRAADRAQSKLAVRRSVRGPRASDLVVVLVTAPLTVARALLTEALMAPLAVIVGAAVYGLAVVVTHSADMTRAGAYAAAAAVAWYALGPGSGSPRRQLNRMAGAVARTRTSAAAITLSVWALAVAAVLFATSQAPYYWPAVDPRLPSLHHLVMSASHWLLSNTHL
jgi:hypothetical protein